MQVGIGLVLLILAGGIAEAQSLADVARKEAARRAAVEEPARVYTNADLGGGRPLTSARAPESTTSEAAGDGGSAEGVTAAPDADDQDTAAEREQTGVPAAPASSDERAWRDRMAEARARVARSRLFAEALQSRINALTADFTARDDPAQRALVEQDRVEALLELERVQTEIEEQEQDIRDLEEDARRAGVPPGWLR